MSSQVHNLREVGATFGKYTLLGKIATGGMGEIFLAQQRSAGGFEKLVVIKRILPHLTDKPEFVAMFVNEARMAAQLSHPNVCQIFELDQVDTRYYMAMEYLEGVPLADVIVASNSHPILYDSKFLVPLLAQACEGLHYAHNLRTPNGVPLQMVHRDINPRNIFVTTAGMAKVLDFGIAKASGIVSHTRTGAVKGTYSYMSPEQLEGSDVDCRSDIFSMGIVAWESLAGRRLFKRASDMLTWKAITEDPIPRLSKYRPEVPAELDEAIAKALQRDRTLRYSTAREFGIALEKSVRGAGALYTPLGIAAELEKAFEIDLAEQRDRVFSAHREVADTKQVGNVGPLDGFRKIQENENTRAIKQSLSPPTRPRNLDDLPTVDEMPNNTPPIMGPRDPAGMGGLPLPAPPATAISQIRPLSPNVGRQGSPPMTIPPENSAIRHGNQIQPVTWSSNDRVAFPRPTTDLRKKPKLGLILGAVSIAIVGIVVFVLARSSGSSAGQETPKGDPIAVTTPPTSGSKPQSNDSNGVPVVDPDIVTPNRNNGVADAGVSKTEPTPRVDPNQAKEVKIDPTPVKSPDQSNPRDRDENKDDAKPNRDRNKDRDHVVKETKKPDRTEKPIRNDKPDEPEKQEPGLLTLDSSPYSTVYIGGKKYGLTPLVDVNLAPGRYSVRMVDENGREKKETVTVKSGEHTRRNFTW